MGTPRQRSSLTITHVQTHMKSIAQAGNSACSSQNHEVTRSFPPLPSYPLLIQAVHGNTLFPSPPLLCAIDPGCTWIHALSLPSPLRCYWSRLYVYVGTRSSPPLLCAPVYGLSKASRRLANPVQAPQRLSKASRRSANSIYNIQTTTTQAHSVCSLSSYMQAVYG